jgi:hypothetical protein
LLAAAGAALLKDTLTLAERKMAVALVLAVTITQQLAFLLLELILL